jgi:enamine deaminase RidA (YjgF/YER057c/UK114 family)
MTAMTAMTPILAASAAAAGPEPAAQHVAHDDTGHAYAQSHEVRGATRWLYVSGQVPADAEGRVPAAFDDQARLAWANVHAQLARAGMTLDHLVKVTIYLADRRWRGANAAVRKAVLGARAPALTIIVCDIYDEAWLLEIEAVAAA